MVDFRYRVRLIALCMVWIGLVLYATAVAPPPQPNTLELIQSLVLGQWSDINPLIVALFNEMGLWPVLYAAVMLVDGQSQSFPAWPFVVLSFGLGAFALLPYLALRQPYRSSASQSLNLRGFGKYMESHWVGLPVLVLGLGFMLFGVLTGSWSDFLAEWQTDRSIHIMSLDFCALNLLFPLLLGDDMKRRGIESWWTLAVVAIVPLIGPAFYLVVRPPLLEHAKS